MKDYPDSGALFKNDRARSDKDPGYNGNGDVTCPKCGGRFEFYLSAWLKVAKSGAKYFSLKFKPKGSETRSDRPAVGDDEVPF